MGRRGCTQRRMAQQANAAEQPREGVTKQSSVKTTVGASGGPSPLRPTALPTPWWGGGRAVIERCNGGDHEQQRNAGNTGSPHGET